MNPKIEELKIKSAKNRILEKYSFIGIDTLYSSLDEKYSEIYNTYHKLDFNKVEYPFNIGAVINEEIFNEQYLLAVKLFCQKISNFEKINYIYISIGFNNIGLWAKIQQDIFNRNLDKFIEEYGANFYFYVPKNTGLYIYRGEYSWQVLSTF